MTSLNIAQDLGQEAPMAAMGDASATAMLDAAPEVAFHSLRRSGQRPIGFRGAEVAHCMSFRVGSPLWYELNLFKAASGGYVADIRMFTKNEGEQDKFTVHVADSLDSALDFFESYDPTRDVQADFRMDDDSLSVADLAFKALGLRVKVEDAKAQYEGMVSEIFSQLDQGQQ